MIKGKDLGQEEKGVTEDELVRWHHWLNGHESEQTLGDSEEQGSLVCTSSWGHKELDTTKWLNNNNMKNPWLTTNQCVCGGGGVRVLTHVYDIILHSQKLMGDYLSDPFDKNPGPQITD